MDPCTISSKISSESYVFFFIKNIYISSAVSSRINFHLCPKLLFFRSFCKAHRPEQKIPQYQLMTPEAPLCPICLEPVKRDQRSRTVIWAPCCKVAWMHRNCIQVDMILFIQEFCIHILLVVIAEISISCWLFLQVSQVQ
jgi:hypothetical protein